MFTFELPFEILELDPAVIPVSCEPLPIKKLAVIFPEAVTVLATALPTNVPDRTQAVWELL
jgi:hypothetical protein